MAPAPITCPKCGSTAVTVWQSPNDRHYHGSTIVYECLCGMGFTSGPPAYSVSTGDGGGGRIPKSESYDPDVPLG